MESYERVRVLGKGSFGKAFLVRSIASRQLLVMKEMKVKTKEELDEALHEATIHAKLSHPNIIGYEHVFQMKSKVVFIVMQYAQGGDLQGQIQRRKTARQRIPMPLVYQWLVQGLLALKYLHENGMIHRDIKAANMFLDQTGNVKLGDFGIARVLDENAARMSARTCATPVGTPMSMAPELAKGRNYGQKVDIWGLGCVVYELVQLKPPFIAQSLESLMARIVRGKYDKIYHASVAQEMQDALAAMFAVRPEKRPSAHMLLLLPFLFVALEREMSRWQKHGYELDPVFAECIEKFGYEDTINNPLPQQTEDGPDDGSADHPPKHASTQEKPASVMSFVNKILCDPSKKKRSSEALRIPEPKSSSAATRSEQERETQLQRRQQQQQQRQRQQLDTQQSDDECSPNNSAAEHTASDKSSNNSDNRSSASHSPSLVRSSHSGKPDIDASQNADVERLQLLRKPMPPLKPSPKSPRLRRRGSREASMNSPSSPSKKSSPLAPRKETAGSDDKTKSKSSPQGRQAEAAPRRRVTARQKRGHQRSRSDPLNESTLELIHRGPAAAIIEEEEENARMQSTDESSANEHDADGSARGLERNNGQGPSKRLVSGMLRERPERPRHGRGRAARGAVAGDGADQDTCDSNSPHTPQSSSPLAAPHYPESNHQQHQQHRHHRRQHPSHAAGRRFLSPQSEQHSAALGAGLKPLKIRGAPRHVIQRGALPPEQAQREQLQKLYVQQKTELQALEKGTKAKRRSRARQQLTSHSNADLSNLTPGHEQFSRGEDAPFDTRSDAMDRQRRIAKMNGLRSKSEFLLVPPHSGERKLSLDYARLNEVQQAQQSRQIRARDDQKFFAARQRRLARMSNDADTLHEDSEEEDARGHTSTADEARHLHRGAARVKPSPITSRRSSDALLQAPSLPSQRKKGRQPRHSAMQHATPAESMEDLRAIKGKSSFELHRNEYKSLQDLSGVGTTTAEDLSLHDACDELRHGPPSLPNSRRGSPSRVNRKPAKAGYLPSL